MMPGEARTHREFLCITWYISYEIPCTSSGRRRPGNTGKYSYSGFSCTAVTVASEHGWVGCGDPQPVLRIDEVVRGIQPERGDVVPPDGARAGCPGYSRPRSCPSAARDSCRSLRFRRTDTEPRSDSVTRSSL